MPSPLVTTIIPVFNRAAMLREAVASVIAQTYRPIEIVIVDDGSTDDTGAAADELARLHAEVRVIHQANSGAGLARETGRLTARGDFIQYLDSDDLLLPRKFELQVEGLRAHPECGVSYGWTRADRAGGGASGEPERRTHIAFETMFPAMLESRIWHTMTPLYRADVVRRAGPWVALRNEEDWEYDTRIASEGVRLHHVAEWIAVVRFHGGEHLSTGSAATLRDRAVAHRLIYEHARRAGITPAAPEMQHYARELFLLARQCGAAGHAAESRMLFDLAREASGPHRDRRQFRLYAALARFAGWSMAGKLATMSDHLRWRRSR